MAKNLTKFVLAYNNEVLLIELLLRLLKDKMFDFTYILEEMGGEPIYIPSQRLSTETDKPIRIEERGRGKKRKEELILMSEQDDLIITVSEWRKPLFVDLGEKDSGKISISNDDGDVYVFQIHC